MRLLVSIPANREAERRWAISAIFSIIGIPVEITVGQSFATKISMPNASGCVEIPDILFAIEDADWLTEAMIPSLPLEVWDTRSLAPTPDIIEPVIPILFGRSGLDEKSKGEYVLNLDVFGAAFFMLSRLEEMIVADCDQHGRFPLASSVAEKENFYHRPIIDEYAEILWSVFVRLWPRLRRSEKKFRINLSHDVDIALQDGFGPEENILLWAIKRSWVSRRPDQSFNEALQWCRRRQNEHKNDPANTYDELMDAAERHGLTTAFYFICGGSQKFPDGNYSPRHPFILNLMKRIHERGHEIGLHPSYASFENPHLVAEEHQELRNICGELGVSQKTWGGRQHYLRFGVPITWRAWHNAGLDFDSTLCFAERPGFRCGTCCEYQAFDVIEGMALSVFERPLILMDTSLFATQYMDLSNDKDLALNEALRLKDTCKRVRGDFNLLWHNNNFITAKQIELLNNILES